MRKILVAVTSAVIGVLAVVAAPAAAAPVDDGFPTTQSADLRWALVGGYSSEAECLAAGPQRQQAGEYLTWRCLGGRLEMLEVFITLSATGALRNADGRCLDIPGGDNDPGTSVRLFSCNRSAAQRWFLAGTGLDWIQALGRCLDVGGGATHNGARVQIWGCNQMGSQFWRYPSNGNQFWIRNGVSGRCLAANGDGAVIADCNAGGQLWSLIPG